MVDYKAIARAITDPENQPHQWNDQDLAKFFVSAADEIERLREALKLIVQHPAEKTGEYKVGFREVRLVAAKALEGE